MLVFQLKISKKPAPPSRLDSIPRILQPIDGSDEQIWQNAQFLRDIQKRGLALLRSFGFSEDDALYTGQYASEHYKRSFYPPYSITPNTDESYRNEVWRRYLKLLLNAPPRKAEPKAQEGGNGQPARNSMLEAQEEAVSAYLNVIPQRTGDEKGAIAGLPPENKEEDGKGEEQTSGEDRRAKNRALAEDLLPKNGKMGMDDFKEAAGKPKETDGKLVSTFKEAAGKLIITWGIYSEIHWDKSVSNYGRIMSAVGAVRLANKIHNAELKKKEEDAAAGGYEIEHDSSREFLNYIFITDGRSDAMRRQLKKTNTKILDGRKQTVNLLYPDEPLYLDWRGEFLYACYARGGRALSLQNAGLDDLAKMMVQDKKIAYANIVDFVEKNKLSVYGIWSLAGKSNRKELDQLFRAGRINKSDMNRVDKDGWTPITAAAIVGNLELVKFLAENGADINQKIRYGLTPLKLATIAGDLDMVKFLVEHGAGELKEALEYTKPAGAPERFTKSQMAGKKAIAEYLHSVGVE